jgi:aryl-phospho-beta-D-glucosidase BglC (GH1 family)
VNRRSFIKSTGFALAAASFARVPLPATAQPAVTQSNSIPRWRGFNFTDFNRTRPISGYRTTREQLQWMVDWGFDFVRLPMAYPGYVEFDRSRDITPEETVKINEQAVDQISEFVSMAHELGLHVSVNLHRAPGYCINAGFREPFNLWKSEEAQEAFYYHWGFWGKRFKDASSEKISFDLLNEPAMRSDMNDQHARNESIPGELYCKVAKRAAESIRESNPNHLVIADGNNVGNDVIPELEDLNIAQSCRGYFPHYISHHKAPWAMSDPENAPKPVWPGEMAGRHYSREDLEQYYKPWIELTTRGTGVHCGECGCWTQTPHDVFLAWFGDVLDILTTHKIGYALWNFIGDFGILDSRRADVEYEDWHGHKLDRKLLDLLQRH